MTITQKNEALGATNFTQGPFEQREGQYTQLNNFIAIARVNEAPTAYVCDTSDADLFCQAQAMFDLLRQAVKRVEVANTEGNPILSAWLPDAIECLAKANGVIL